MSQFQSPQLPILRRIQSEKIPYIRRSKSINRSRSQSLLKNLTRKTPAIILRSKSLSKKRKSSSPIKRSSYSVINIFDDINNSFNLHNIPIYIQYIHQLYNKSTVKTLLDSTKPKSCLPSFNSKNSFFFIFRNTYNNDILGFLGLSKKGSCLYIKYLCIYDKYRNLSLGIFMGFCAVYYAEKNKINYIISYGVSDQYAESEYERNPSYAEYPDKIVLSQLLLIKKLGFIDVLKIIQIRNTGIYFLI